MTAEKKEKALEAFFENQKKVIIAFSGGADSSLLASAAMSATMSAACIVSLAVTVKTELVSNREIENARAAAEEIGIRHVIIEKEMLKNPDIENNRQNRCYACKKELLISLLEYAAENGFETVVEGTNESDRLLNETGKIPRPGLAFISEQKERQSKKETGGPVLMTPLTDLKITKEDVRELLKRRNLSAAGKPSGSCLATRLPYNSKLTPSLLKTIGTAEEILAETGAKQIRVRCHTDAAGRNMARIEVGSDEGGIFFDGKNKEKADKLISFLKQNGFAYVTVDLEGFRSGSMDI
ncbi:MAG: ATP-dependent sacrificial sulfur transferase LarE [Methanimicrococcus sp.]|nr:ATP-dependent sacrificial sulfur transferase LarE [Methanimicrococcus sp.]